MRTGARVRAAAVAVLAVVGALVAPVAPASAAPLPIEYSANGTSWSSTPLGSVFPSGMRIVPGDEISATIYLRTTRTAPTELSVLLTGLTVDDPAFGSNLVLGSTPNMGFGLAPTVFDRITACTPMLTRTAVAAYQVVALTVTVGLSADLPAQVAQNATANFNLVIGVSDTGVGAPVPGCSGPRIPATPGGGSTASAGGADGRTVAHTGSDVTYPALAVAAVAWGVGWIFVMIGRRRRRQTEPTA